MLINLHRPYICAKRSDEENGTIESASPWMMRVSHFKRRSPSAPFNEPQFIYKRPSIADVVHLNTAVPLQRVGYVLRQLPVHERSMLPQNIFFVINDGRQHHDPA